MVSILNAKVERRREDKTQEERRKEKDLKGTKSKSPWVLYVPRRCADRHSGMRGKYNKTLRPTEYRALKKVRAIGEDE